MTLRMSGLVSGFSTDNWVKQIMDAEKGRVQSVKNKRTVATKLQTALGEVRTAVAGLQSKLDPLRLASTFQPRQATTSDPALADVRVASGTLPGQYTLSVTQLAQAHRVASGDHGSRADALGLQGRFEVNGVMITLEEADSLDGVRSKINAAKAGVSATITESTVGGQPVYRLTLAATATGQSSQIRLAEDPDGPQPGDLLTRLKLDQAGGLTELAVAQDAKVMWNGEERTHSANTLTNLLPGLTLTLKAPGSGATVNVTANQEPTVEAIQAFVDAYNSTVDQLTSMVRPDGDGRVSPLVGDMQVNRILTGLRRIATASVVGMELSGLSQIGLTTGRWDSADAGKLTLDPVKLREKLAENPEAVTQLFTATNGVGAQLNGFINQQVRGLGSALSVREDSVTRQVSGFDKQIERLNDQLARRETALRAKFQRMEEALSRTRTQGTALANGLMMMMPR